MNCSFVSSMALGGMRGELCVLVMALLGALVPTGESSGLFISYLPLASIKVDAKSC